MRGDRKATGNRMRHIVPWLHGPRSPSPTRDVAEERSPGCCAAPAVCDLAARIRRRLFSGADDTLVLSIEAVGSPPLRRPKKRGPFQLVPVMATAWRIQSLVGNFRYFGPCGAGFGRRSLVAIFQFPFSAQKARPDACLREDRRRACISHRRKRRLVETQRRSAAIQTFAVLPKSEQNIIDNLARTHAAKFTGSLRGSMADFGRVRFTIERHGEKLITF
jgi:hypothetical protein